MPLITSDIELAAQRLEQGALVAIPTETVYGLAARADLPESVARVFALKGRPASNPLIVHLPSMNALTAWTPALESRAQRLVDAFWPGPLTLVLPALPGVSRVITAGQDSVALRLPAHPQCRALLETLGRALVAPSANRFMAVSPTTAEHVAEGFAGEDLLVLDGGACTVGLESTILAVLPGEPARLLRPGTLDVARLEAVLGEPIECPGPEQTRLRAPGQHHRHYAPRTPAWRFAAATADLPEADPGFGWIFCGQPRAVAGPVEDLGADPAVYARHLYAALHRFDRMGLRGLLLQCPPETTAWRAVHNRLQRACREWDPGAAASTAEAAPKKH